MNVTWNHRLIKIEHPETPWVYVAEVYYRGGEIIAWTRPGDDVGVGGETMDEVEGSYKLIGTAFEKPVLLAKDLPGYVEGEYD